MDETSLTQGTAMRRNDVSPAEWAARVDLAAAHHLCEHNRWTDLIFNHLTVRVPGEPTHFLIKRHSLYFEEVTASNLIKVDLEGKPAGTDEDVNTAGFTIHSAVFNARPDVQAVMHVHSDAGIAISMRKAGLRFLCQEAMQFYNRVAYHDFVGIALDLDECASLQRDLGPHNAMIMRNHGVLTCGSSVAEAALRLRTLIMVAETQLRAEAMGAELNEVPAEVCEHTAQQYEQLARQHSRRTEWEAVLRWLDRRDPSYRN